MRRTESRFTVDSRVSYGDLQERSAMKNLRHPRKIIMIWRSFFCGLGFLFAINGRLEAQALRIAAVSVDGFDAASTDVARWERFAGVLRSADADLVAIEGIPQRAQAANLVSLLKPASYQLAVFGAFTNGTGNLSGPGTFTILSKRQPFGARSAEWRATGQVELPGGFAFAGFRSGTNAFCFYLANLPGDGLGAFDSTTDSQAGRKRELAAQYLAHHVQWLGATLSNHLTSFCVVSDLVTEPRANRLENAGRILQQAGFGAWMTPVTPENDEDVPFTALLARGATLRAAPVIVPQDLFKRPVCVYELNPGGASGVFTAGTAGASVSSEMPKAAVVWIWAGVIVGVCGLTGVIWWLVQRSSPSAVVFQTDATSQLVLEVDEAPSSSTSSGEAGLGGGAEEWQTRSTDAEQQAGETTAQIRAGFLQQLQSLFRDRLVAWLAAQRGRLVASHQEGTEQVLELEERLQRIQGHFEEQIQSRDQRITELEREVQAKEALIRKLLLARANPSNQSPAE